MGDNSAWNFERIPFELRQRVQFVVWRFEQSKTTDRPTKVPYNAKTGFHASSTDRATWCSFEEAVSGYANSNGRYDGIGFVFSKDDPYCGIDLDDPYAIGENGEPKFSPEKQAEIAARHARILKEFDSYAELSPSGKGVHIICEAPVSEGRKRDGVELYFKARYFTMTGNVLPGKIAIKDHTDKVRQLWEQIASQSSPSNDAEQFIDTHPASPISDDDLRERICNSDANREYFECNYSDWSAAYRAVLCAACLFSSDEAQVRRVVMASPLVCDAPPKGRETRPAKAARLWATEYPKAARKGAQERRERAQAVEHGGTVAAALAWPAAATAIPPADPGEPLFNMTFVSGRERAVQMEHFIDPWLPKRNVIGLYGRGEAGKSTWASSLCAFASKQASTLWVSSEEDTNHIALRFTHSGGEPNTLITLPATPTKIDKATGKAVATNFNVYEHLETAINDFQKVQGYRRDRPLGIVVLDAINALVTWGKGENANDDASVKRLLAHLHSLAMNYDLSIVILGHVNKHTRKEHVADAVTGSAAWTNSLRRAFLLWKDEVSDDYEGFIRTAKGNTGTAFAASYRTVPVHTLLKRVNGADEVLCNIAMTSEIVWGERDISKLTNDSDDDDPMFEKRKKRNNKIRMLATHIAKAIREGATARDSIEASMPADVKPIHSKHWIKIDQMLAANFGIEINTTAHGKYEYKVRTTDRQQISNTPLTPYL